MLVDDPVLPAIAHVTGERARDIVDAVVAGLGGILHDIDTRGVQYRPDHDLVVQFRAEVTWPGDDLPRRDTLLAAVAVDGALPGTLPVTANVEGTDLVVSVWRWPFDPMVPGIEAAATLGQLGHLLRDHVGDDSTRDVVAYQPTERAVVRATSIGGKVVFVKAVPPAKTEGLVDRHRRLLDAGLPVPAVLDVDFDLGVVVLEERPGTTLRERIKDGYDVLVNPEEFTSIAAALASADRSGLPVRPGRIADTMGHARLIGRVFPAGRARLDQLREVFEAALPAVAERSGPIVHGDLHEGQLVVDDSGHVTGLLDVDSLSIGDPLDDVATLLGHLTYRRLRAGESVAIDELIGAIRASATDRFDADLIDLGTSAVLVGLATGPFRTQAPGWEHETDRVLEAAFRLVAAR